MKKYPAIDIFRLVCAVLVVMIHFSPNAETAPAAHVIKRCFTGQAVPYFLITSGFFFTHKFTTAENNAAFIKSYCIRIFLLYGIWTLLKMPATLETYLPKYEGRSTLFIIAVLARRLLVAGTPPFWYLLALGETALLTGILLKRKKEKLLYGLGLLGFVITYLYDTRLFPAVLGPFYELIYTVFSWKNNFLMLGISYFSLGVLFHRRRETLNPSPRTLIGLYAAISAVGIGCILLRPDTFKYLSIWAPQSALLFLLGLSLGTDAPGKKLAAFCRRNSAAIYSLHCFTGWIVSPIKFYPARLFTILAVCILVCELCRALKLKPIYRIITLQ